MKIQKIKDQRSMIIDQRGEEPVFEDFRAVQESRATKQNPEKAKDLFRIFWGGCTILVTENATGRGDFFKAGEEVCASEVNLVTADLLYAELS